MRFDSAGVQGSPSPLPSTRAQDKSSPVPGKTCVTTCGGGLGIQPIFFVTQHFFHYFCACLPQGKVPSCPWGGKKLKSRVV